MPTKNPTRHENSFDFDSPATWDAGVQRILPHCIRVSKLTEGSVRELIKWLKPLAIRVARQRRVLDRTLVVGIAGAQGSGKTTLSRLLKILLSEVMAMPTVELSIDDLYYSRSERKRLSEEIHSLFQTRGVPGTHDVTLGLRTLRALIDNRSEVRLPRFDKANDEIIPRDKGPIYRGVCSTILFEGWCVGARPQPLEELRQPFNALEREMDSNGIWRRFVNHKLETDYREIFSLLDYLVMLKVPDMECIRRWRGEQEKKLAEKVQNEKGSASAIMNQDQLERFIQHYERLTSHMLHEMPSRADALYEIDDNHNIVAVRFQAAEL
jgi:D-glycerate 3-kinase